MNVTAAERRDKLNLFNVAEAARWLDLSDLRIYRDIRAGYIPKPEVKLGKRHYYRESELKKLNNYYRTESKNERKNKES